MKSKRLFLGMLCAALLVFGAITSANADTINLITYNTIPPGDHPLQEWVVLDNANQDAGDIAGIVGYTGDLSYFVELYKQDAGGSEKGPYAPSYMTSFGTGYETATITLETGATTYMGTPLYLFVKDGKARYDNEIPPNLISPAGYIYNISNWDRTSPIYVGQLWPGEGSISHVALYGPVPIPAAAWLLGSGLIGLVAVRRRFTKK